MRDHRQRQEGDLQEGFGQCDAQPARGFAQRATAASRTCSKGWSLINPATRQCQLGLDNTSPGHDETAPDFGQPVDGDRHIRLIRADHDDIVGCHGRLTDAIAPHCMPKPFTKPRPIPPLMPCRSTTATRTIFSRRINADDPVDNGQCGAQMAP